MGKKEFFTCTTFTLVVELIPSKLRLKYIKSSNHIKRIVERKLNLHHTMPKCLLDNQQKKSIKSTFLEKWAIFRSKLVDSRREFPRKYSIPLLPIPYLFLRLVRGDKEAEGAVRSGLEFWSEKFALSRIFFCYLIDK